jgi:hypothetical protein
MTSSTKIPLGEWSQPEPFAYLLQPQAESSWRSADTLTSRRSQCSVFDTPGHLRRCSPMQPCVSSTTSR